MLNYMLNILLLIVFMSGVLLQVHVINTVYDVGGSVLDFILLTITPVMVYLSASLLVKETNSLTPTLRRLRRK